MESIYCCTTPKGGKVRAYKKDFVMATSNLSTIRNVGMAAVFSLLAFGVAKDSHAKVPASPNIEAFTEASDPVDSAGNGTLTNVKPATGVNPITPRSYENDPVDTVQYHAIDMSFHNKAVVAVVYSNDPTMREMVVNAAQQAKNANRKYIMVMFHNTPKPGEGFERIQFYANGERAGFFTRDGKKMTNAIQQQISEEFKAIYDQNSAIYHTNEIAYKP